MFEFRLRSRFVERPQRGEQLIRRLLGDEVTAGQALAGDVIRHLPPHRDDVEKLADRSLGAPEREERLRDPALGEDSVNLLVDRRRRSIILTHPMDGRRVAITA